MGVYDVPDPKKVRYLEDLLHFVRHYHGTPTGKSAHIAFAKGYRKFVEANPHWAGRPVTYEQMARVCDWGVRHSRGRVRGASAVLYLLDDALKVGVLPELEQKSVEERTDEEFYEVMGVEFDPDWRIYLMSTSGSQRVEALQEWRRLRGNR